jgi:DNA-binding winged helix-turn-helix (wHTH) protein
MRYRVGQFEVDAERYELRRDGSVEAVEPLVFNLILFLARNPNRVISRDEVIEAVWSGPRRQRRHSCERNQVGATGARRQR